MNTYYLLITNDETERAVCIICSNPMFIKNDPVNENKIYCDFYLPDGINIKDHTQVTEAAKDILKRNFVEFNQKINFDDANFIIYEYNDYIRYEHGNIVNRNYIINPVYVDDCTLNGQTTSESDTVSYEIHDPQNRNSIIYPGFMKTTQDLGNYLVDHGYVDHFCNVIINDGGCDDQINCQVNNGKFIIPATIVNKEVF